MKLTVRKWDASKYLDSPEIIREYLTAAFEEGDTELLMVAIGNVVRASGHERDSSQSQPEPPKHLQCVVPGRIAQV